MPTETSRDRMAAVRHAVRILATEVIEVALADRDRIRLGHANYGHMETADFLHDAMKAVVDRVHRAVDEQVFACLRDAAEQIEPDGLARAGTTWMASLVLHAIGHEAGKRGIVRVVEAAAALARDREGVDGGPLADWLPLADWSPTTAAPSEPDQVPF